LTRGEVFFRELEESGMMAKSTLSKHLGRLKEMGLVERTISKKRKLGSHDVVYVSTPKGRETYSKIVGGNHLSLEDF
jgi:DNA-binding HxlR family transcriptional regulator